MTKEELLRKARAFLFDLDGTVYLDETPIGTSVQTLQRLRQLNKRVGFLTNNSSKTEHQFREKLRKIGLYEDGDVVYTSGMATIAYLKKNFSEKSVYLLGTDALWEEFAAAGVHMTEENPDVCVLAYDVELTFDKIRKFDAFLQRGAFYVATHPDDICPTKDLPMPDVGSFIAMFERSCGRKPDRITGKPFTDIGDGVLRAVGYSKGDVCMVGDRMDTDIRFANNNGLMSVLVLSGETTLETMRNYPDRPDIVLNSMNDLL